MSEKDTTYYDQSSRNYKDEYIAETEIDFQGERVKLLHNPVKGDYKTEKIKGSNKK